MKDKFKFLIICKCIILGEINIYKTETEKKKKKNYFRNLTTRMVLALSNVLLLQSAILIFSQNVYFFPSKAIVICFGYFEFRTTHWEQWLNWRTFKSRLTNTFWTKTQKDRNILNQKILWNFAHSELSAPTYLHR